MLSVALIGPDGAGKTTISRQVEQSLPIPAKYVYMGVNLGSSNILLPTSRLIVGIRHSLQRMSDSCATITKEEPSTTDRRDKSVVRRLAAWLRSYLRLANLLAEECFRHLLVWYYQRRGMVVLLDRWFFADYYAYEVTNHKKQPLSTRIHHLMLERVYPKPDLVIYLEAPAAVLFARKGEGTLESLEQSRQKYLRMRETVKHYFVVDANQATLDVVSDVTALILDFYIAKAKAEGPGIIKNWRQYES